MAQANTAGVPLSLSFSLPPPLSSLPRTCARQTNTLAGRTGVNVEGAAILGEAEVVIALTRKGPERDGGDTERLGCVQLARRCQAGAVLFAEGQRRQR